SRRSARNSATPRRSARTSLAPQSSPLGADDQLRSEASQSSQINGADGTPRSAGGRQARNFESMTPFFESSPAPNGSGEQQDAAMEDGDRTPRATGTARSSSPIGFQSSSIAGTPGRNREATRSYGLQSDNSDGLFVRSSASNGLGSSARNRRHDIQSDVFGGSANARRQRVFVDENGMPSGSGQVSDAATFSNLDPNTSDAEAMGGKNTRVIWGTNISLLDTLHAMKDFYLNFQQRYRMYMDGEASQNEQFPPEHPANAKVYVEMMNGMLELDVRVMNLDVRNLKAYPPTRKLWHQIQQFPEEIIPIMDTA
ncbi:hypothetical protein LTS18_002301, partial [Coniosporium uncinatum]